ncbi:MAG: right-handed parallel beta-helix repeat-containing protein, partial [Candidatus Thermoplasmatota archaeon]
PEPVAFRTGETDLEYVKTGPILVEGEDGFDEQYWKGDGSEGNPYELKEAYEIDATGEEYGIKIKNSSKHVVIEDTEIYGASGSSNDTGAGIYLYCTDNVQVIGNSLDNNDIGIYSFSQAYEEWNYVKNNTIQDNEYGLYLDDVQYSLYKNNNISRNTADGIYTKYHTMDIEIVGNRIKNNGGSGIEFYQYCSNNLIEGNNISKNDGSAIHLEADSGDNQILENHIENNSYGIEIVGSGNNEI